MEVRFVLYEYQPVGSLYALSRVCLDCLVLTMTYLGCEVAQDKKLNKLQTATVLLNVRHILQNIKFFRKMFIQTEN